MEELKKQGEIKGFDDIEILFQDEMRYGLISNYRRSWSKVGERTELKNQMEYVNRYLYSAIAPISGNTFHLIGFGEANGLNTKIFLEKLKKEYPNKHLLVIWDNAPFHRLKALHIMKGVTILPLPPYSPQLNPAERFFGELRKSTANRTFENIGDQEKEIEKKLKFYYENTESVKQLSEYDWIRKQVKEFD